MIIVTLALPDGRNQVTTNANTTIKDFLAENNVRMGTATVMLDGMALSAADQRKTFRDHGIDDTCTIAICAKLQNA